MQAMRFSVLIPVLLLCQVALAQSYSIRVEVNTNLRAGYSLESAVLESAPAGSILQVIDSYSRWLKINRNGRELWMASWVRHSRVAESSHTAPAAEVDNCCFVDRQCQSNKDWIDGYWAYQRNQCPLGAPAGTTAAQPVSSPVAAVDNCCFVDRQCNSDQEWLDGYWAYQNNQCAAGAPAATPARAMVWTPNMTEGVKRLLANPSRDPFNNCCFMHHDGTCHSEADWQRGARQYQNHECVHPSPLGTRPSVVGSHPIWTKLVRDALELMRIHTPEWLHYIDLSGARQFELMPPDVPGGFFNRQWSIAHGFYAWQLDDPNWAPDPDYVVGYAGGITHEACHAIQQRTYTQTIDWANELPCVEAQLAVIAAIKPDSKDVPWLSDLVGHPDSWRR